MNRKIKIAIGIAILILILVVVTVFTTMFLTGRATLEFEKDNLDFSNITNDDNSTNCIKISEVKKLCKLGTFEVKAGEIKEGDFNVK